MKRIVLFYQAYPFWSFGAELGGYVGMFLGISFMQVQRKSLKPISFKVLFQMPNLLIVAFEISTEMFRKLQKALH